MYKVYKGGQSIPISYLSIGGRQKEIKIHKKMDLTKIV